METSQPLQRHSARSGGEEMTGRVVPMMMAGKQLAAFSAGERWKKLPGLSRSAAIR